MKWTTEWPEGVYILNCMGKGIRQKGAAFPGMIAIYHSTACHYKGRINRGWKGNKKYTLTKPRALQTSLGSQVRFRYSKWLRAGEKGKANFKCCWFSVKIGNSSKEHIQEDAQFVFGLCALRRSLLLQSQMFLMYCTNSCYTVFEWIAVLVVLGHNNSPATENTGYRMRKTKSRFCPCFNIILWSFSQLRWETFCKNQSDVD